MCVFDFNKSVIDRRVDVDATWKHQRVHKGLSDECKTCFVVFKNGVFLVIKIDFLSSLLNSNTYFTHAWSCSQHNKFPSIKLHIWHHKITTILIKAVSQSMVLWCCNFDYLGKSWEGESFAQPLGSEFTATVNPSLWIPSAVIQF